MDSTIHSHMAGLYIQDRIAAATAARQAREARPARTPRPARRPFWHRGSRPRPGVAVNRGY